MPQSDNYGFPNPTTIKFEGFEDCDELVLIRTTSTEQLKVSRFPRATKEWKKRVLDEEIARPSEDGTFYLLWKNTRSGTRPATDTNGNLYCKPTQSITEILNTGFGSGYVSHTMWSEVSHYGSIPNLTIQTIWNIDITKKRTYWEDIYDEDWNWIGEREVTENYTYTEYEIAIGRQENSGDCQFNNVHHDFVMNVLNEDGTYTPIQSGATGFSGNIRFQRIPPELDEEIDSNWQEFGIYSYSFDISPWGVICGDLCPEHCTPVYEKKEDEFVCVCLPEDGEGNPTWSDDPFDRIYFPKEL